MRRIKVDSNLDDNIKSLYSRLLIEDGYSDLVERINILIQDYQAKKRSESKVEYLRYFRDNLFYILSDTPHGLNAHKYEFERILPNNRLTIKLKKEISNLLKYQSFREKYLLKLLQELKLKSCVYCNAQLCVVIDVEYYKRANISVGAKKGDVKTRKAYFECDHHLPKSKYPCFEISYYNLIPVCSPCNSTKSNKDLKFNLYTEGNNLDEFEFKVDNLSIFKYWRTRNINDIEILFSGINDPEIFNEFEKYFKISVLYETQKDIVEELLHKRIAYNAVYKNFLQTNFNKKLFPDNTMISRLLIGTYANPDEIHKRPMTKFTQDIAKQLGLI